MAKGIHVLHLGLRPKFLGTLLPNRDVRVTSKTAFLHVAVTDSQIRDQLSNLVEIKVCLPRRTEVRFADDLDEWYSTPIDIDQGIYINVMDRFPGILFHVDACEPDAFPTATI